MFPHVSANATMAEGGRESELVVADVPEDQKHLICVEYPGIHAHTRNFSLCSRPYSILIPDVIWEWDWTMTFHTWAWGGNGQCIQWTFGKIWWNFSCISHLVENWCCVSLLAICKFTQLHTPPFCLISQARLSCAGRESGQIPIRLWCSILSSRAPNEVGVNINWMCSETQDFRWIATLYKQHAKKGNRAPHLSLSQLTFLE